MNHKRVRVLLLNALPSMLAISTAMVLTTLFGGADLLVFAVGAVAAGVARSIDLDLYECEYGHVTFHNPCRKHGVPTKPYGT